MKIKCIYIKKSVRRERKIMKMEENALAIDIHTQNVYKMIKCRYAKGTESE